VRSPYAAAQDIRADQTASQRNSADVDWLYEIALEMEAEDGVIWVQGLGDYSVGVHRLRR
jgi:hypothetical protein